MYSNLTRLITLQHILLDPFEFQFLMPKVCSESILSSCGFHFPEFINMHHQQTNSMQYKCSKIVSISQF